MGRTMMVSIQPSKSMAPSTTTTTMETWRMDTKGITFYILTSILGCALQTQDEICPFIVFCLLQEPDAIVIRN